MSDSLNRFIFFTFKYPQSFGSTDELKNPLANIDCKFSVIGISETWLTDTYTNVDLDSYNFIQHYRHDLVGGGVGLYLDNNMIFEMRDDLSVDGYERVESLFVEICQNKGKGIIVGIIYKSCTNAEC